MILKSNNKGNLKDCCKSISTGIFAAAILYSAAALFNFD